MELIIKNQNINKVTDDDGNVTETIKDAEGVVKDSDKNQVGALSVTPTSFDLNIYNIPNSDADTIISKLIEIVAAMDFTKSTTTDSTTEETSES